jgi:sugar O-acyltransferase (sialic acid O-acetyltransferase NeuD family)
MKMTFVYGAGAHGKVVCNILEAGGVRVQAFVDANPKSTTHFGKPIIVEEDLPRHSNCSMVIAIGANYVRQELTDHLARKFPHLKFQNAVHPSASVANTAKLGVGCVVAAGAIVGVDAIIGDHCVINTGSQVDHDCCIEDFVSLAPGAILGGSVHVGKRSYVALGAKVIHGVKIGRDSVVGAGSVVVRPVQDFVLGYGNPFAVVRTRHARDPYL